MSISKKDWKLFGEVKAKALDRYCQSVLDEVTQICNQPNKTSHERYLEVWDLTRKRNKAMMQPFDGHTRSRAMLQLKLMRSMGLVDEDDVNRFDPDSLW